MNGVIMPAIAWGGPAKLSGAMQRGLKRELDHPGRAGRAGRHDAVSAPEREPLHRPLLVADHRVLELRDGHWSWRLHDDHFMPGRPTVGDIPQQGPRRMRMAQSEKVHIDHVDMHLGRGLHAIPVHGTDHELAGNPGKDIDPEASAFNVVGVPVERLPGSDTVGMPG